MKRLPHNTTYLWLAIFALGACTLSPVHAQKKISTKPGAQGNLSLRLEIEHAIDKGIAWLKKQQDPETGAWSETDQPALTALAVAAIAGDPSLANTPPSKFPPHIKKGNEFIVSKRKFVIQTRTN